MKYWNKNIITIIIAKESKFAFEMKMTEILIVLTSVL